MTSDVYYILDVVDDIFLVLVWLQGQLSPDSYFSIFS